MTVESIITIGLAIASVVLAPLIYIWRAMVQRIERLENKVDKKMDEDEVRVLLNDKIEPINQNIEEVKHLLYQVLLKINKN